MTLTLLNGSTRLTIEVEPRHMVRYLNSLIVSAHMAAHHEKDERTRNNHMRVARLCEDFLRSLPK